MTGRRRFITFVSAIPLIVVGSRITLPGVNAGALRDFVGNSRGGLLGLYEMVFQGGLRRGAILGIGIMPYVTARVVMWLWRFFNPKAETSKGKTRVLTLALTLIQSVGFATSLQRLPGVVADPGPGFLIRTVLTVTAASLIAMWFGEQLTEQPAYDPEEELDQDSALRGEIGGGNFAHASVAPAAGPEPRPVRK